MNSLSKKQKQKRKNKKVRLSMVESSMKYTYTLPSEEEEDEEEIIDMSKSIEAVEKIIKYTFKNKNLIEAALTHSSYTESENFQRLEFVGDAALGLAVSNFCFIAYPDVDPGKLSLVRAANVSTEKLARVAVRHKLYNYVRHNAVSLDQKVKDFVTAVEDEEEAQVYGGLIKAPKVLADIVEAIAAAIYVDCEFNLQAMWLVMRYLLEPIVILEALEKKPQPTTTLLELCQKDGKQVDIKHWRKKDKNIASVYVDGQLVASASSEQKEHAKLHAAKFALEKLFHDTRETTKMICDVNDDNEIVGAKQKLHELCGKKKWPRPVYKQEVIGVAHAKRFKCSVEVQLPDGSLSEEGYEKTKLREAENSAASLMLHTLHNSKYA